jgi:hypothetical protein
LIRRLSRAISIETGASRTGIRSSARPTQPNDSESLISCASKGDDVAIAALLERHRGEATFRHWPFTMARRKLADRDEYLGAETRDVDRVITNASASSCQTRRE